MQHHSGSCCRSLFLFAQLGVLLVFFFFTISPSSVHKATIHLVEEQGGDTQKGEINK